MARGGEETSGGVLKSPRFFISSLHSSNAAAAPGFSVYNTQQHIMRRTDTVLYDISASATRYQFPSYKPLVHSCIHRFHLLI